MWYLTLAKYLIRIHISSRSSKDQYGNWESTSRSNTILCMDLSLWTMCTSYWLRWIKIKKRWVHSHRNRSSTYLSCLGNRRLVDFWQGETIRERDCSWTMMVLCIASLTMWWRLIKIGELTWQENIFIFVYVW